MIVAGASSYSRLIDYEKMAEIASEVSAFFLVDMAHIAGLVAGGVIPSPVPHADFVTFTTYKTLGGGRGGVILCRDRHASRIDRSIFPGGQGTPSMDMVAAKAVCFQQAMEEGFRGLQQQILDNAKTFASVFREKGYRVVSGGTDNHLVLIDVKGKGFSGDIAERTLEQVGIVVNRNVIPYDSEPPDKASGIRIGASAITSRGMKENEARKIAELIDRALSGRDSESSLQEVARNVDELCRRYPVYAGVNQG
jgi:glycine hydroxymethyltransferase